MPNGVVLVVGDDDTTCHLVHSASQAVQCACVSLSSVLFVEHRLRAGDPCNTDATAAPTEHAHTDLRLQPDHAARRESVGQGDS